MSRISSSNCCLYENEQFIAALQWERLFFLVALEVKFPSVKEMSVLFQRQWKSLLGKNVDVLVAISRLQIVSCGCLIIWGRELCAFVALRWVIMSRHSIQVQFKTKVKLRQDEVVLIKITLKDRCFAIGPHIFQISNA